MPANLATNPLSTLMRGSSGPPGSAGMGAPGAAPAQQVPGGALAQLIGKFFNNQQSADPEFVVKQLSQIQQLIGELIPKTLMRMDGVAVELAPILRHLSRAIEKAKEQASVAAATRHPPIGFGGATPGGPLDGGGLIGGGAPGGGPPQ